MGIAGGFIRFSMTSRLMVGGTLVAVVLWFALDMLHSARTDAIVHANLSTQMRQQAEAGRDRFRETLDNIFSTTALLAATRPVAELTAQALASADGDMPLHRPLAGLEPLGERLTRSDIACLLVIDGQGRTRAIIGNSPTVPPSAVHSFLKAIPVNADHRAILQRLDREVYVVGVHPIAESPARLVVLVRWDRAAMARGQGMTPGPDHIVAIADMFHRQIAASGDPERIEPGMPLAELERDWLLVSEELPEHGGVNFLPAFVSMVPKSRIDEQAQPLLRQEREQRTAQAVSLIGFFLVVMGVLGARLRQVIERMAAITGSVCRPARAGLSRRRRNARPGPPGEVTGHRVGAPRCPDREVAESCACDERGRIDRKTTACAAGRSPTC